MKNSIKVSCKGVVIVALIMLLQVLLPILNVSAEDPVSWAEKQLGKKDWVGYCLKFVNDAFERAGYSRAYYGSANEAAKRWAIPGTKDSYSAPRGAVHLYVNNKYAHICISRGGQNTVDGSYNPLDGGGSRVCFHKANFKKNSGHIGYGYYNSYGNTNAFRDGKLEEVASVYVKNIGEKSAIIGYIFNHGVLYRYFQTEMYLKSSNDTEWRYVKTENHKRGEVNESFYPLGNCSDGGTQWTNGEELIPGTDYVYKLVAVFGKDSKHYSWESNEY